MLFVQKNYIFFKLFYFIYIYIADAIIAIAAGIFFLIANLAGFTVESQKILVSFLKTKAEDNMMLHLWEESLHFSSHSKDFEHTLQ